MGRFLDPARDLPNFDPAKGFKVIDHDTCEELVLPRPHVIVHKRPAVLYSTCDGETRLVTVGGMIKVFPKCAASPEILTQIAIDRLHYHRTLYRIERLFAELGCPLARSTICSWMIWLGKLLAPIMRAQEMEILNGFKLHADDTDVRVQAPGQCDRVRVWVLIGGANCSEIVFRYTESRTSETVLRLIGRPEQTLNISIGNFHEYCKPLYGLNLQGKLISLLLPFLFFRALSR